jgi:hypothetical protein
MAAGCLASVLSYLQALAKAMPALAGMALLVNADDETGSFCE